MSIESQVKKIAALCDNYLDYLRNINEEQFQETPAEGVWSYSEVYSHIFGANKLSLVAVERCVHSRKTVKGRTNLVAHLVFLFGMFPPVKLKVPKNLESSIVKLTREEAKNLVIDFRNKLQDMMPQIKKASPEQKNQHPRLGLLNASQWLRFVEIHTKHHYKQLLRIKKMLAAA